MNMSKTIHQFCRFRQRKVIGPASEQDMALAQPVFVNNPAAQNRVGVLLLHGFRQNPFCMHHLTAELKESVYQLSVPVLPHHLDDLDVFEQTTAEQWISCAQQHYQSVRQQCDHVIVVGLSMGAVLAALVNDECQDADHLVLLAPAFYPPSVLKFSNVISSVMSFLGFRYLAAASGDVGLEGAYDVTFCRTPIKIYPQLNAVCVQGRKTLSRIHVPVDFFVGKNDQVLNTKKIKKAFFEIPSADKRYIQLSNSKHVLSLDAGINTITQRLQELIGLYS